MFSDSRKSIYDYGWAYAVQRNFRLSWYVLTATVQAGAEFVTWAQLRSLRDRGCVIGHHSQNHNDISSLADQEAMETEIAAAEADLVANGLSTFRKYFLNPGGQYNSTYRLAMEAQGVILSRNGMYAYNVRTPLPVPDYLTLRFLFLTDAVPLAEVIAEIDGAVARGEVLAILLDGLVDGPAAGVLWALADYQAMIDYLIDTVKIPLITDKHLVQLGSQSVVVPKQR